ncbi:hypothetical protein SAY86_031523 [Trapa natans]|uniref:5-formyltetrahydrofolate cyclo-ligase n=1 Tax=Trapa natans TaxID=22666 RepID=A0AAN7M7R3_TRANT|nr:hypothetical protein SAY86_031523 [Trapa natans]
MGCLSAISVISVAASRFLTSPSFFLSRPRHIRSISRLAFIASSSLVGLRSFSITMDGGDSNGNRGDQKLGADLDAVFNEKRVLRSKVRKALRSMDPLHRSFEDDAIQRIVLDAQWFRSSQRLCAYISCSALREVDTSKILSEILRNPSHDSDSQVHKSKKVYVPRVEDNNCHMRMLNISSVDDLIANSMNILEPAPVDADGNEREDAAFIIAVSKRRNGREGGSLSQDPPTLTLSSQTRLQTDHDLPERKAPSRPNITVSLNPDGPAAVSRRIVSGLNFDRAFDGDSGSGSELHKSAAVAWQLGKKFWNDLLSGKVKVTTPERQDNASESCPHSITVSGSEFLARGRLMVLPCGLTLGSYVTVVGKPRGAHAERDPKISLLREGDDSVMVSQFHMELQGLRAVEGEDPPRVLHFNPRLKGDWSGKPVIEQNTCYRMQWGTALRCEGWKSKADEETVDGQLKCEKWIRDDDDRSEESKTNWWLNRLVGKTKKVTVDWPYPFSEGKLFVMTLGAGLEGYHVNVDGKHVTSFPYRTGFSLEDATGLTLNGDVDVHYLFASSLPTLHPNYAPQSHLDLSRKWQAPPLPDQPIEMFIGILSAGNHFAERMSVRKSWMQHKLIKSSIVVARFFVALVRVDAFDLAFWQMMLIFAKFKVEISTSVL